MIYDIFISYKRKGSSDPTAVLLYSFLNQKGYATFLDRKEIRQGKFDDQLLEHIEEAQDVLILLEEGSLDSCFVKDQEAFNADWFCKEIIHALSKGKRIIPLLLNGYVMPSAEKLPKEMKELTSMNALNFDPVDLEGIYEKYFIARGYLESQPRNLVMPAKVLDGVSDYLIYSDQECEVYECGEKILSLTQDYDEDHPYRYPVKKTGEHRFLFHNERTGEIIRISSEIEMGSQRYICPEWKITQRLWNLTAVDIMKEDRLEVLYLWGTSLFRGSGDHDSRLTLAMFALDKAAKNGDRKSIEF